MSNITEILNSLPTMKAGNELISELTVLPNFDANICNENAAVRLMALSELHKIFLPSQMSLEIYSKLYLALLRSLQKKTGKQMVQQQNENYKAIRQMDYTGILGGSDSFTIIGTSGIGKSSAISRAIDLISANGIIFVKKPYMQIIPTVVVQCPFDSSVKGLLLEILRKVDEYLDTKYYQNALRVRATTDMLIGSVSQVALNHIGLLVVDEIQNVVNNKHGKSLVGMLTQLINNSGISICMVGTPESTLFFEQAMQLARRSLGLQYNALPYDQYFYYFCEIVFSYQYVRFPTVFSEGIAEWLYEHSSGIISVVISLIHDAQEIAILNGTEALNMDSLNEAYQKRLSLLHNYIEPSVKRRPQCSTPKKKSLAASIIPIQEEADEGQGISELVAIVKKNSIDIVSLLKQHMPVVEVEI